MGSRKTGEIPKKSRVPARLARDACLPATGGGGSTGGWFCLSGPTGRRSVRGRRVRETRVDDGRCGRDTNRQQCAVTWPFLHDVGQGRREKCARDACGGSGARGRVGGDE